MSLKNLISQIAGHYPDYRIEHRALNLLTFFIGFNCLTGGFFAIFFGFELSTIFFQFFIATFAFSLYFFTKIYKIASTKIVFITAYTILLLSIISWFEEGGINGPVYGVAAGFFYLYVSISSNRDYSKIFPISYIITLLIILFLDYNYSEWVVNYSTKAQRYLDLIINFFQTVIPVYLVHKSNQECYQYEQQQVEEKNAQLAIANSTKEKLFAIIGHDLRSPIASLDSLLLMLNEGRISKEELTLHLQKIQNKTGQIRDLLDNLLYWAVSQMEHLQTNPVQILLFNIVETELSMLREQAMFKELTIENNIATPTTIFADNEQSKIILRNILTNAVRYTTNGGKITIANYETESLQVVKLTNSGKWNEDWTSTNANVPKRTGFGLVLSKDFAKRNGGDLEIDKSSNEMVTVKWTIPKHLKNV